MYLRLTSPHMHGPNVVALQKLLIKGKYYHKPANGIYGEVTAQAVWKAKYTLGYKKPDRACGDTLPKYLQGTKKPTLLMRQRAAARKKNHRELGYKILKEAVSYLGMKEHPANSNRCPISTRWGLIGPWCAMFYSTDAHDAGSKTFKIGSFEAYVPTIVRYAKLNLLGLRITKHPVSGDGVCMDWQHDGLSDHIGCFAEEADLRVLCPVALLNAKKAFGALRAGDFWCVEGNTSIDNDSNGGEVMLRKRNESQVQAFVHPTK